MRLVIPSQPGEHRFFDTQTVRRVPIKVASAVVLATVALAPPSTIAQNLLVQFDGAIGAIGVSAGLGTGTTATTVTRNIVRGVQPPNTPWAIADFRANVTLDGHITATGKGLVFAGGDTIGTANGTPASGGSTVINVFATLICENTAPFTQRNTRLQGVPLAPNGDFQIDDVLSPWPPLSACATPVLLIRNAANQNFFAAGIQNFGTQNSQ